MVFLRLRAPPELPDGLDFRLKAQIAGIPSAVAGQLQNGQNVLGDGRIHVPEIGGVPAVNFRLKCDPTEISATAAGLLATGRERANLPATLDASLSATGDERGREAVIRKLPDRVESRLAAAVLP